MNALNISIKNILYSILVKISKNILNILSYKLYRYIKKIFLYDIFFIYSVYSVFCKKYDGISHILIISKNSKSVSRFFSDRSGEEGTG